MSVKERILTIRLIDKVNANPAAAEKVGIIVTEGKQNHVNQAEDLPAR